ncbi:nucleoside triphosphate pyrophosphohydrolase [Alkalibacillus aidingensis]|uniref:nucleoside triphosphate pyrophosphohydrolase n=1 Tax=Alkalibacillus aidingensis TaxID=2747607 RepID=UPI0016604B4D|nr:nucleoside triphosphate pyrophosphohydrolase [Alkalibacillus aidingensis]
MPIHNKLIRDKIPEIIEATGKSFSTKKLSEEDYIKELRTKLSEEVNEYLNAKNDNEALEELADIVEVIHSLAKIHGNSFEKVEQLRVEKAHKRGVFDKRIFLKEVED